MGCRCAERREVRQGGEQLELPQAHIGHGHLFSIDYISTTEQHPQISEFYTEIDDFQYRETVLSHPS
jgi:hypothetical protein